MPSFLNFLSLFSMTLGKNDLLTDSVYATNVASIFRPSDSSRTGQWLCLVNIRILDDWWPSAQCNMGILRIEFTVFSRNSSCVYMWLAVGWDGMSEYMGVRLDRLHSIHVKCTSTKTPSNRYEHITWWYRLGKKKSTRT